MSQHWDFGRTKKGRLCLCKESGRVIFKGSAVTSDEKELVLAALQLLATMPDHAEALAILAADLVARISASSGRCKRLQADNERLEKNNRLLSEKLTEVALGPK